MDFRSPFSGNGVDLSQIFNVLQNIVNSINSLTQNISQIFPLGLSSSKTYDPPNLTAGTQTTTTVTCAGAVLGMSAQAAFSLDITGLTLTAYVSAADTVTCVLYNGTVGAINLGSGTLSVWARSN